MSLTLANAKSIVIRHKQIDSWFASKAHLNIYRGCAHNCAYCDGRYDGYHVEGDFGSDIVARSNAPELLDRALNPHRKRHPLNSGYLLLGGGVSDSYQPVEKKLELAARCLEVIYRWRQPVHILTKSSLVERDLNLIAQIHQRRAALVSMSFSTVDDNVARVMEPGCSPPSRRLETLSRFKSHNIPTGMFLLPVIPGVSDSEQHITQSVAAAADAGVSFIVFGGMTLKPGRQQTHFSRVMQAHMADVLAHYPKIYRNDPFGAALPKYYQRIEARFARVARKYKISRRIPPHLFAPVCNRKDRMLVALDQLAYLQNACNDCHPFAALKKKLQSQGDTLNLLEDSELSDSLRLLLNTMTDRQNHFPGEHWFQKYL